MPFEARESEEAFFEFIKTIDDISARLKNEGIMFGYHNHSFEFKKYNGKTMLEHILDNTNSNCKLIYDVYWAAHAGINPIKVMEKYADRIVVMHYKDKKVFEGNDSDICEIGEGFLDWDEIIEATVSESQVPKTKKERKTDITQRTIAELTTEMKKAAELLQFELAAKLRDEIKRLKGEE